MNTPTISFFERLRGFLRHRLVASPAGTLLLFVQRSPLVKMLLPEARLVTSAGLGEIATWTVATVAGLGAYDSVSGATTITQIAPTRGSDTVNATTGKNLTFVFQLSGYPDTPGSWQVTGLPAGLKHADEKNNTIDSVSGTPTQTGTFPITVTAYEKSGRSGDRFSKRFVMKVAAGKPSNPPEIDVLQPAGVHLVDGKSGVKFATTRVGRKSGALNFTIANTGKGDLSGLNVKLAGRGRRDFKVRQPSSKTVAPGASTTFKVFFKPKSKGVRKAALRISNNDPNENPFDVKLKGRAKP